MEKLAYESIQKASNKLAIITVLEQHAKKSNTNHHGCNEFKCFCCIQIDYSYALYTTEKQRPHTIHLYTNQHCCNGFKYRRCKSVDIIYALYTTEQEHRK